MKDAASQWIVVTADQSHSRRSPDAVPDALEALGSLGDALRLPFDRTVGDEIQALTIDTGAVVEAVVRLSRVGEWRIGIGVGDVEVPLPATSREARGPAYVAAREAVEAARRAPGRIAVRCGQPVRTRGLGGTSGAAGVARTVTSDAYGEDRNSHLGPHDHEPGAVVLAESALVALRALLAKRTEEGWQAMDLLRQGLGHRDIAARLGVSESAVSQRFSRAQRDEAERAASLAVVLLDAARRGQSLVPATPEALVGPGAGVRAARR